MMIETTNGAMLTGRMVGNYFHNLVDLFFKILPLRESEEATLQSYMKNLQAELMGCEQLLAAAHDDAAFMSLLSILQYLIDHPDAPIERVKSNVFKSISLCNKLAARYGDEDGTGK